MSKRSLNFAGLPFAALSLLTLGCATTPQATAPVDPQVSELERLKQMSAFVFAYETASTCSLEVSQKVVNQPLAFESFDHKALVGMEFDVLSASAAGNVMTMAVSPRDEKERTLLIRNVGTAPAAEAWNCAVATEKVPDLAYRAKHRYLRLDGESCVRLSPILGTQDELTLSPYTVVSRGVFVGNPLGTGTAYAQGSATSGFLLEAMGGRKRMWVSATDLDSCFANSDRPPPPPGQAQDLLRWLQSENPDAVDPPDVTYDTVAALTGITQERCSQESFDDNKEGFVCNAPVIHLTLDEQPNGFGQRGINFVRDRSVAGLYFQDGKVVSPLRAVNKKVVVNIKGGSRHLTDALKEQLRPTIEDETKRRQRAASGRYALLEYSDQRKATHTLELNVERQIPDVEVTEEQREHVYLAGTIQAPNPAYAQAQQAMNVAAERIETVKQEGVIALQQAQSAQALCSEAGGSLAAAGAGAATDQLTGSIPGGGLLKGLAKKATKEAVSSGCEGITVEATQAKIAQRVQEAAAGLAAAQATLQGTPQMIAAPDRRVYPYTAKTYRRRGVAEATITVRDKSRRKVFEDKVSVPFETTHLEVPEVPEVQLKGQAARPPSVEDVESALSVALVPLVENSIVRFSLEALVGERFGDAQRGTRPWAALVASEASSNRPVKLLMDLLENRNVESGSVRIPVSFPEDSADKCFTFAATDSEGKANVDLVLRGDHDFPLARDSREHLDAAFELCGRKAEKFELELITPPGEARAVLVSLFESTPGKFKAADVATAAKGSPHIPLPNDVFVLDASGEIRAKSTGGSVVVGRNGDRDGDGVGDESDRCPYEIETENYFLDDDGCPDETPPGFVPDPEVVKAAEAKRAAAIAAGTATAAQIKADAERKAAAAAQAKAAEEAKQKAAEEAAQKKADEERRKKEAADKARLEKEALAAAKAKAAADAAAAKLALKEAEAARKKAEEERRRAEAAAKKAEEERVRAEERRKKEEEAQERAEAEKKKKAESDDASKEDPPKKKPTEIYIP